jgi:hypothetical protein
MTTWSDDRACALHHALMWIEEWRHSDGIDRDDARRQAQAAIRYFKRFHRDPERAAFEAAVERSKRRVAA